MSDSDLRTWAEAHADVNPQARAVLRLLDRAALSEQVADGLRAIIRAKDDEIRELDREQVETLAEWQAETDAMGRRVAPLEAALAPIRDTLARLYGYCPWVPGDVPVRVAMHEPARPGDLTVGDLRRAAELIGKVVPQ